MLVYRLGLKPGEWESWTPADIWAYRDGAIWRRAQDLQALAVMVAMMPRFSGEARPVPETARLLQGGVRSQGGSQRANQHELVQLLEDLKTDLTADPCEDVDG